jgi:hypothetical protein
VLPPVGHIGPPPRLGTRRGLRSSEFSEGSTGPIIGAHQGHSAVYDHRLGVRETRSIVNPKRHASGDQRIDATCASVRRRPVGDHPNINAALFGPDQRPNDAGTDRQAVGRNEENRPRSPRRSRRRLGKGPS